MTDARDYYYQALMNKQQRDAQNPILDAASAGWKGGINSAIQGREKTKGAILDMTIQSAQKTKQTREDFLKSDWLKYEHFKIEKGKEVPLTPTENFEAFKSALDGVDLPNVFGRRIKTASEIKPKAESFAIEKARNKIIGEIQQGGYTEGTGKNAVQVALQTQEEAIARAGIIGIGADDPDVSQVISQLPTQADLDAKTAGIKQHSGIAEIVNPLNWGGKSAEQKNAEERSAVAQKLRGNGIFNRQTAGPANYAPEIEKAISDNMQYYGKTRDEVISAMRMKKLIP